MVVAVPILLGMPASFLRVVPRVMAAPAFLAFSPEVFAGVAGLRAPLAVAGYGTTQFSLGLFDVVLTLRAIFVGPS